MLAVIHNYLKGFGVESLLGSYLIGLSVLLLGLFSIAWILDFVTARYLVRFVRAIMKRAHPELENLVTRYKLVKKTARMVPAMWIYVTANWTVLDGVPASANIAYILRLIATIYMIVGFCSIVNAALHVVEDNYNRYEVSKKTPIKSYLQVVRLLIYIIAAVFCVATLLDKSPVNLFTALGAATAALLFVFKDSILSFIASIQLASFDMIRIGDWVAMPSFGADGNVIEISLSTVKIRNFDKTVTTIPTHALLSNGVKNWRGMKESGGRRIKRAVYIDAKSVSFCSENMIERFMSVRCLNGYLKKRLDDIKTSYVDDSFASSKLQVDNPLNERRLTNIGVFRAYLNEYLHAHRSIYDGGDYTFLVRQLQPTDKGLPLEIYVFTNTTDWVKYEEIQADIFDHVFAALPFFGLRAFQSISDQGLVAGARQIYANLAPTENAPG